jgi:hypothetical protein
MADEMDLLMFTNFNNVKYTAKPREVMPRNNPFDDYNEKKFKERFRLSKRTVEKLLEQVCIANLSLIRRNAAIHKRSNYTSNDGNGQKTFGLLAPAYNYGQCSVGHVLA